MCPMCVYGIYCDVKILLDKNSEIGTTDTHKHTQTIQRKKQEESNIFAIELIVLDLIDEIETVDGLMGVIACGFSLNHSSTILDSGGDINQTAKRNTLNGIHRLLV